MGSKSGDGQTQRIEPPAYQLPYLQAGLGRAEQLYSGAPAQTPQIYGGSTPMGPTRTGQPASGEWTGGRAGYFNPGSQYDTQPGAQPGSSGAQPGGGQLGTVPIAGFSPDQVQAQHQFRMRAVHGDPTINAASGYVRDTLGGGFMNGNPYADAAFEKARLATQGGLASEFGRSGRNVEQSQGLRSQQLNDLATSMYGGMYENERNRMQGVLPYAQQLGNQQYTDAAALAGSGALQQGQQQRQMDAPGTALDQYLARIRGTDYGSTTTQPGGGFSGGGALGGAMIGNMLFPGLGGILGGSILGGLF
jgi:hypothetical protein